MTDEDLGPDCAGFPCPRCGDDRVDFLAWLDDEFVQCASCGWTYRP
ncbi:MAG TPA: hypothetical protein VFK06_25085 [Candidatus Angelobacter sp.]|nr:hypothetical protein [Candidatus Angelobacter sp.]